MSPFARVTSLCTSKGDFGEKKINQTLAEVSETSVVFFFLSNYFPLNRFRIERILARQEKICSQRALFFFHLSQLIS